MKKLLASAAMIAMILLAWSADGATAKKKAPAKKGASKTATTSKRGKKTPGKRSATTWRNRQLSPSTDRYREIQQALAAKGYLNNQDATGTWNAASVDALKKFQSEQNLEPSGKINSLSLIALG